MRKIVFSLLPLLLPLLAGCSKQTNSPVISEQTAQENAPAASSNVAGGMEAGEEIPEISEPKKEEPRFWQDWDAAKAIEVLGFDHAWVYRWQNGAVEASVLFDTLNSDDEQERWDFKSREIPTKLVILDKPHSSGVFVVALTRQSDGVYECRVGARVLFDDEGDTGKIRYGEVGEIHLPPDPKTLFSNRPDGTNSEYLTKGGGENKVKFVKISFSPVSDEQ